MATKTIITSDSTVDLSPELRDRYHIQVCPLCVEMDGQIYHDGVDVKPDDVYAYYERTGNLAKSSACNVAEYLAFFQQFTNDGYAVVHISLSSHLSASHQNAKLAAGELENVYVVDSLNLSTGTALLVIKAAELVEQGAEPADIAEQMSQLAHYVDASFVIDTLDYLHAGGRCSTIAKLGANLLKLKPSIQVTEGKMGVSKKYRGKLEQAQKDYVNDKLANLDDIDTSRAFVTHSGMPDEMLEEVVQHVKKIAPFREVLVTRAGCVITVHCGPKTVGVLFVRKTPLVK